MAIKESALSLITSIAQGDWIRAVTSAGASRRVTVANLAKAIVESYTGSSLAGSNQSVKSALDSINSKITVNNATTLVEDAVAVSGNTSWRTITGTISNIDQYKYVFIYVAVHGAQTQTQILPASAFALISPWSYISVYWTANDLGQMKISRTGEYIVSAKTQTLAFDYLIIGIK